MRHHDFIQKKVLEYMNNFYSESSKAKDFILDDWDEFIEEITDFDKYDNYIDLLLVDEPKVVILQYFYSHVDENGKLASLDETKLNNVWINDNLKYYKTIEEVMNPYLDRGEN